MQSFALALYLTDGVQRTMRYLNVPKAKTKLRSTYEGAAAQPNNNRLGQKAPGSRCATCHVLREAPLS